mmetsp:Transcript_26055/g.63023  ORF Transcript_26055/g.63023 Transcript_26055/m.63023 type:complete len:385 (+) Transcript_26055:200-1354(+)
MTPTTSPGRQLQFQDDDLNVIFFVFLSLLLFFALVFCVCLWCGYKMFTGKIKVLEEALKDELDQGLPDSEVLRIDAGKLGMCRIPAKNYDIEGQRWKKPMLASALWRKAVKKLRLAGSQAGFLVKGSLVVPANKTLDECGIKPGDLVYLVLDTEWSNAKPYAKISVQLRFEAPSTPLCLSWSDKNVEVREGVSIKPDGWILDGTDVQPVSTATDAPQTGILYKTSDSAARFAARKCSKPVTFRLCARIEKRGYAASPQELLSAWGPPSDETMSFMGLLESQVRTEAEEMNEKVLSKLSSETYDDELQSYVTKLVTHKEAVKALCGAPWKEWSAPGTCQVCNTAVDRKEKGLHCANGGHRICWACMVKNIDWCRLPTMCSQAMST